MHERGIADVQRLNDLPAAQEIRERSGIAAVPSVVNAAYGERHRPQEKVMAVVDECGVEMQIAGVRGDFVSVA